MSEEEKELLYKKALLDHLSKIRTYNFRIGQYVIINLSLINPKILIGFIPTSSLNLIKGDELIGRVIKKHKDLSLNELFKIKEEWKKYDIILDEVFDLLEVGFPSDAFLLPPFRYYENYRTPSNLYKKTFSFPIDHRFIKLINQREAKELWLAEWLDFKK